MIVIKVNWSNGDHTITGINATLEEARDYYEGQFFNIGLGPNDNILHCIGVELLEGAAS